jgi:cation transport regulator ChaC
MPTVGILAYGSLIDDPGPEIAPRIKARRIVRTPFRVEFARKSGWTRGGSPTLVRVRSGGSRVRATLLILDNTVTEAQAADLLWRRETRHTDDDRHYRPNARRTSDSVRIERIRGIHGVDVVLYAQLSPNIRRRSPQKLARLAIASARVAPLARNGIQYLLDAKRNGIRTPLSRRYEAEILRGTGAKTLAAAAKTAPAPEDR